MFCSQMYSKRYAQKGSTHWQTYLYLVQYRCSWDTKQNPNQANRYKQTSWKSRSHSWASLLLLGVSCPTMYKRTSVKHDAQCGSVHCETAWAGTDKTRGVNVFAACYLTYAKRLHLHLHTYTKHKHMTQFHLFFFPISVKHHWICAYSYMCNI